jgi:hypothetical protein
MLLDPGKMFSFSYNGVGVDDDDDDDDGSRGGGRGDGGSSSSKPMLPSLSQWVYDCVAARCYSVNIRSHHQGIRGRSLKLC